MTFAHAGPNSRSTQLFINFGDNIRLDRENFPPFGEVEEEGMSVVDRLHVTGEGGPGARACRRARSTTRATRTCRRSSPSCPKIVPRGGARGARAPPQELHRLDAALQA